MSSEKPLEIERKFTIRELPPNLESYPHKKIEQAYLNTNPVIRIRKEDSSFYMTYKGKGMLMREEYNLPLDKLSYEHLKNKADGNIISKTRYLIPVSDFVSDTDSTIMDSCNNLLTVELDLFDAPFSPLILAEVEFPSKEAAECFIPLPWFLEDVTFDPRYHNSNMSRQEF